MNVTGADGITPPTDNVVLAGGRTVVVTVVGDGDVGPPELAQPTARTETPSKRANTTATNERRPDMRHPHFFENRSTQRVSFWLYYTPYTCNCKEVSTLLSTVIKICLFIGLKMYYYLYI